MILDLGGGIGSGVDYFFNFCSQSIQPFLIDILCIQLPEDLAGGFALLALLE